MRRSVAPVPAPVKWLIALPWRDAHLVAHV